MVKSRTILMVYCFAIQTIFQAAGFPTVLPISVSKMEEWIKNIYNTSEGFAGIPNFPPLLGGRPITTTTSEDSCWNIENGLLKKEIKNWDQTYSVNFEISVKKLPTSLWLNVFHFTATNNDIGTHGDRIPGMWINKDGYFHICTSLNGNANACKNIGFELEKTYQVTIKQVKDGRQYFYEIIVDGISKFKEENKKPLKFSSVSLYGSDPWYDSFTSEFGSLCNVAINQEVDSCWNIENGLLKKEMKNWGQTYSVNFEILVKKLPPSLWLNVFHFTATNDDVGTNGDRIPGMWISKNGSFLICTSLNGNANACKYIGFELEKTYQVTIRQVKDGRQYFYEIIVDGISRFKEENKKPLKFSTVSLYGSDQWYDSFTSEFGSLCNVAINQEVGKFLNFHCLQMEDEG
jgi:hypothetical protein